MFKKLISNISFSPALVGQLGFYAKRLKKEEATRKLGLIFTALALVVQSFTIFVPPAPANASSNNDFVRGGINNVGEYLSHYDRNTGGIKDFYNAMGVTRAEIANAQPQKVSARDKSILSWGRHAHFGTAQGERAYTVDKESGGSLTMFARPLWKWGQNATYDMFVGYSKKVGWFAIMKKCGNFATKTYPVIQICDSSSEGLYPNCRRKTCPDGQIGTYPECKIPQCKNGQVGTYPNCKDPECPTGTIGTYPDCKTPVTPVAFCDALQITTLQPIHSLAAKASAKNGAKITGYTYTISRDGKEIEKKQIQSSQTSNTLSYKNSTPGKYTVSLAVKTTAGEKTGSGCIKTFTVSEPKKCQYNTDLLATSPECQPCSGDGTLWIKDDACVGVIIATKTAQNITQNKDATSVVAKAGDRITYKITARNTGKDSTQATFVEQLKDVIEYASIVDNGGGTFDKTERTLQWPSVELKAGETQTRLFTVQLSDSIPEAAQGQSDKTSYDCVMTNTYGNSTNINVDCPAAKVVEQVVTQLPTTGPSDNILFAGVVLSVVTYFYVRSRQLKRELYIIRHNFNTGSL